jgi:hypothetical protein
VKVLFKRLIILAIAIIIVVPALYFAINLQHSAQNESNPLYYAPSDVNALGYVNYNGTQFYIFATHSGFGLIFDTSSISSINFSKFSSFNGMGNLNDSSNLSFKTNISLYANYNNYDIYSIRNLSISLIGFSLSNQTLYLYENNGFLILGNLNGVYESINGTVRDSTALGYSSDINTSANVSLAVFTAGSNIKSLYFNVSGNNLTGSIEFKNYTYEAYFLSAIIKLKGASILSIYDLNVKFKLNTNELKSLLNIEGVIYAQ